MKASFLTVIMTSTLLPPGDLSLAGFSQIAAANTAKRGSKATPASLKLYRRAVDAFEAKNCDDAMASLTQLLQKQSDYQPARLLLGRCLYQQKRYGEAVKIFSQLEEDAFEPESSYEYGQAAFNVDNFAAAMTAFRAVPNGHTLYDLSGYYGGISAYKVGDYDTAVSMLKQAVVLPSKLVRSQTLYLREAEKMQQQKPSKSSSSSVSPPILPAVDSEEPSASRSYRYLRPLRTISLTPRVLFEQTTTDTKDADAIGSGELKGIVSYDRASSERSSHYMLQATAALTGLSGDHEREEGMISDVRREAQIQVLSREPYPTSMIFTEVTAGMEWPLFSASTIGLQAGYFSHTPSFFNYDSLTTPMMEIFLAQKGSHTELVLKLGLFARFEGPNNQFTNPRAFGALAIQLPARFQVNLESEYAEYIYSATEVDGPAWFGRSSLEIGYFKLNSFHFFVGSFFQYSRSQTIYLPENSIDFTSNDTRVGAYARSEIDLIFNTKFGLMAKTVNREYSDLEIEAPASENKASLPTIFDNAFATNIASFSVYLASTISF